MPHYSQAGFSVARQSTGVLRALVDLSPPSVGGIRKSVLLDELAACARSSQAHVALTMKYAVANGYAERVGPRWETARWVPTALADELVKPKSKELVMSLKKRKVSWHFLKRRADDRAHKLRISIRQAKHGDRTERAALVKLGIDWASDEIWIERKGKYDARFLVYSGQRP